MGSTMKRRAGIAGVTVLALVVTACGSDDDEVGDLIDDAEQQLEDVAAEVDEELDELADDIGDALGGGDGGGTLVFDGEEIPIDGVTCVLDEETFDVGTVSDNGFRVFVSKTNPANDASVQILDADSIQWFPRDVSGDEAERDGGTFTAGPYTFFNNQNDETVEAQVTVECP